LPQDQLDHFGRCATWKVEGTDPNAKKCEGEDIIFPAAIVPKVDAKVDAKPADTPAASVDGDAPSDPDAKVDAKPADAPAASVDAGARRL